MRLRNSALGTAAALASLAAVLAGPQAQAADPGKDGGAVAPRASALASEPSISPDAPSLHASEGLISCPRGSLCTSTWNPVRKSWKIYKLDKCALYSVSHWEGNGAYINSQTDGAVAKFYDANGKELWRAPADGKSYPANWSPVWKIRNC